MGRKRTAEEMHIRQMATPEAAYVAGVVDGEGTIGLTVDTPSPNRPRYKPRLQISNTDLVLLGRLNEMVGGGRVDGKRREGAYRACYALNWMPTQMRGILPQLLPFLVAKRRQAEALLRYFDLIDEGPHGAGEDRLAEIEAIHREVCRLNQRGLPRATSGDPFWEPTEPLVARPVFRTVCEHCGGPVAALMPHKRFCSDACQAAHYQQEVRGPAEREARTHVQECPGCGEWFETGYASRKYCGRACYLRHRRALAAEARAAARYFDRACMHCGERFPWNGNKKRYCSPACVQAAFQERKKAGNS